MAQAQAQAQTSQSIAQGLTPKKSSWVGQLLLLVGIVVALTAAGYGLLQSSAQDQVLVAVRDIPYGQQIAAADVKIIALPKHRAAELQGIPNAGLVVGNWAGRTIHAGDVVQPQAVAASDMAQPVYPNGILLPSDHVAVPFEINAVGPITDRDVLNIGVSGQDATVCSGTQSVVAPDVAAVPFACRVFDRIRILYIDVDTGTAFLAMTPYQAQAYRAYQASGVTIWAERYGAASRMLPILDRLDVNAINADQLQNIPLGDQAP